MIHSIFIFFLTTFHIGPFTSLLHIPSVLTKLPPNGGEDNSEEQDETASDQVGYGQEVVLTPEPADCGQYHFLSALEGIHCSLTQGFMCCGPHCFITDQINKSKISSHNLLFHFHPMRN